VCFFVFSLFLLVRMFFSLPLCEFLPLSQAAPVATVLAASREKPHVRFPEAQALCGQGPWRDSLFARF
jgi:hypothetical protein